MPGHPVPQRTDITGQGTPVGRLRAARPLRVLAAALVVLSVASAPMPVRAASALSDGGVIPTTGTTATAFTFSVHYASTDNPARPAQAVWAQVGTVTVTLTKIDGSAHDGTWQGTATLPAGTWQMTFHAATSGDTQPEPLPGPMVTVTEPPPTPQPLPPAPQPTRTASPSPSPTPTASGTPRPAAPTTTADPVGTPGPSDPAADDAATPPRSMLASFLIIGGSMSIAGAALLARQWQISRKARQ